MKINANAPAFPAHMGVMRELGGLTIRAEIASRFFAAMAANPDAYACSKEVMAQIAVDHADALIAKLNED